MANFGNYPGDFILKSGDWEIWSKNWSLLDYPGELTAQYPLSLFFSFLINHASTIHLQCIVN